MSLDVHLRTPRMIQCPSCQHEWEISAGETEVYWRNITHNLGQMAAEAGIYECLWRPDEIGVRKAKQLIALLAEGLEKLRSDPERFKKFDAPNGWGTYSGLVSFVASYLAACMENPEALVEVSR